MIAIMPMMTQEEEQLTSEKFVVETYALAPLFPVKVFCAPSDASNLETWSKTTPARAAKILWEAVIHQKQGEKNVTPRDDGGKLDNRCDPVGRFPAGVSGNPEGRPQAESPIRKLACQLFIAEEVDKGLDEGKSTHRIGKEISEWVARIFRVKISSETLRTKASRARQKRGGGRPQAKSPIRKLRRARKVKW